MGLEWLNKSVALPQEHTAYISTFLDALGVKGLYGPHLKWTTRELKYP